MNKEVIYIDVEDDITAIIGKVKDAKEKIVALVPPKRVGVLQSAVNLRLLTRTATQQHKRLVLITSNSALIALAAAAKIPVAKTLQSKPEIAEISALDIDDGEDVIDGSSLPVGELMKTADTSLGTVAFDDDPSRDKAAEAIVRATPPAPGQSPGKPRAKSGIKVPNFSSFRKKLLLAGAGGVLLIIFLIWAIFFAPHATVVITARTTDSSINDKVTLDPSVATSAAAKTLKTTVQQIKKDSSVEFTATGSKDVGDKATGTVKLSKLAVASTTIPAGTQLTATNGLVYITNAAAVIPPSVPCFPTFCAQSTTVGVTANGSGTKYNGASGDLTGAPDGASASFVGSTSGGTDKTITVVTADDIQKAADQLAQQSSDDIKKQLVAKFGSDFVPIDQTFKVDKASPQSAPAQDQEAANGTKPKLTASVTYSLAGVAKSDLGKYLDDHFAKEVESEHDQRVYDNGIGKVTFTTIAPVSTGYTASIVTNAKIGPKIDDEAIKQLAKGKRYGEVQSSIESIQGVDNVDIKFSPFWVSSVPSDTKKISIEFKLNEK